ncbi:MAG: hypothetical protein J0I67_01925 [Bosea sp.]|nr:hypothetical protein [Bosea sp. (in: a-proteobacteria)]
MCSFTLPPLIGLLLVRYDWRTVEIQMGVLVLLLVPLIVLAVREMPIAKSANSGFDENEHRHAATTLRVR